MPKNLFNFILVVLILAACQPAQVETPAEGNAAATSAASSPTSLPTAIEEEPAPTEESAVPELPDDPVEISYFAYHGGAAHGEWETANAAAFMAANPGITLNQRNLNIYSAPVPQSIDDRMVFDPPPDVVSGPMAGLFLDYVNQGLISDITDLWEENGWYDKFPESVIDMASVNGRQYFVPTMLQFHPIWYNAVIFAQHNVTPPQTWEELLVVCDTLSSAGQTPFTVSIAGWNPPTARWFTYLNMRVNGPDFHASLMRGQIAWTDPRVFTVFEYWQQLFDHRCFSEKVTQTGYQTAANQVADGEAAMYLLGEWLSESYPDGIPAQLDHFPFPVIEPSIPTGEIAHQYGAFLHVGAQHPEEAKAFLTWFGSVEAHNSFGEALHRISTHADINRALFDDKYWRGAEMTANAHYLTSLFELGTHEDLARAGLTAFASFFDNPGNIATFLNNVEKARERAYGSLPEPLPDYSNVTVETLATLPVDAATGGVTIDSEGVLYVADIGKVPSRDGPTVYKIAPDGEVGVFIQSDDLDGASGNTFDSQGNLYQSSFSGSTVHKITPDGNISLYAADGIVGPVGLVFDAEGSLYVANCRGDRLQKVTPDGESTVFVNHNGLSCPNGLTIDENGNLYVANFANGKILKVTPDGAASLLAELPGRNNGHLAYFNGILYATDRGGHQVFAIHTLTGEVKLVAGTGERGLDDGPGLEATFSLPNGIAISSDGTRLYINHVTKTTGSDNFPVVVRVIILPEE